MNKVLLILRHEIFSLTSRFSFWFGVFGLPLLGFLIYGGVTLINSSQGSGGSGSPISSVTGALFPTANPLPQGYVDRSGIIRAFPPGFPKEKLIRFDVESAAEQALKEKKINAYYVVAPDYLQTGQLDVYTPQMSLMDANSRAADLQMLLNFNLLGGDARLTYLVENPLPPDNIENVSLAPQGSKALDRNSQMGMILPYGVMMLSFMGIMGTATLMLNSLANEKENRIMEILMISATPHQFLLGKIIGLGLVGLFQLLIWGISGLVLLQINGQMNNLPPELLLNPSILAWGAVFFLLGYLIYATLMAGVGALVPSLREASQATIIIMLPMMVPIFLLTAMIQAPNGWLAVALSLFPLTAPTSMMLRLAAGSVPLWQLALSIVLLIAAALVIIRAVAGMFRAQTILSGQTFSIKRLALALMGKI